MKRSGKALLLAAVVIAGCGSNDARPPSSTPGSSDQAAEGSPALSEAEVQERLDRATNAVKDALARAKKAGSAATLSTRLEASAGKLDEASSELQDASAPPAVQETATALGALAAEFDAMAADVGASEFCTAPAALASLTRSGAARDVRAAAKALRADGFAAAGLAPRTQRKPAVKLANGMVLTRKGGTRDGVVKIVAGGNRTTVHVRRKATTTVTGIPDATYRVFFASGSSWDGKRNTFSRNCSFTAFDDKMKFTSGGGQYTRYTITLNAVAGGNARTKPVDPSDFPRD